MKKLMTGIYSIGNAMSAALISSIGKAPEYATARFKKSAARIKRNSGTGEGTARRIARQAAYRAQQAKRLAHAAIEPTNSRQVQRHIERKGYLRATITSGKL